VPSVGSDRHRTAPPFSPRFGNDSQADASPFIVARRSSAERAEKTPLRLFHRCPHHLSSNQSALPHGLYARAQTLTLGLCPGDKLDRVAPASSRRPASRPMHSPLVEAAAPGRRCGRREVADWDRSPEFHEQTGFVSTRPQAELTTPLFAEFSKSLIVGVQSASGASIRAQIIATAASSFWPYSCKENSKAMDGAQRARAYS